MVIEWLKLTNIQREITKKLLYCINICKNLESVHKKHVSINKTQKHPRQNIIKNRLYQEIIHVLKVYVVNTTRDSVCVREECSPYVEPTTRDYNNLGLRLTILLLVFLETMFTYFHCEFLCVNNYDGNIIVFNLLLMVT